MLSIMCLKTYLLPNVFIVEGGVDNKFEYVVQFLVNLCFHHVRTLILT